jgi:hypothetical protein
MRRLETICECGDEDEIDTLELTYNWQPKPELSQSV